MPTPHITPLLVQMVHIFHRTSNKHIGTEPYVGADLTPRECIHRTVHSIRLGNEMSTKEVWDTYRLVYDNQYNQA